jgi:hypothetical protein
LGGWIYNGECRLIKGDYLLSYPEENTYNEEQEGEFLAKKSDSGNEIEIVAFVENAVVGTAGSKR